MRTVLYTIVAFGLLTSANAQTPSVLRHITRIMQGSVPLDGQHRLTVRWYDVALGGTPWLEEDHTVTAVAGLVELRLGERQGIPAGLLERGTVWLGYSIDGGAEENVREQLLTVPYARVADRAAVADRLAPDITGIVTSINEIAGAVRVVGDSGITVRRQGDALHLRVAGAPSTEQGRIPGDGRSSSFRIRPASPLTPTSDVTVHVVSVTETVIAATIVQITPATNDIHVVTSAILTEGESLVWRVTHR